MATLSVDPAQLTGADAQVAVACAHARAALHRVEASARDLFEGWHGSAAAQFRLGWSDWSTGAHELLAELDAMAGRLGSSGTGYADTEAAVRTALTA